MTDSEHVRRLTHALLHLETAVAAAEALHGCTDAAAVEGLVELVARPPSAPAAVTAISALSLCQHAIVPDALWNALASPHASVRLAAIQALQQRDVLDMGSALAPILRQDASWIVRRSAVRALGSLDPASWHILIAATDPHWRVRHALIQVLLEWGSTEARRQEIDKRLGGLCGHVRVRAVCAYLRYRWTGCPPTAIPEPGAEQPRQVCAFWNEDPAVLARNLERLGKSGRRHALDAMPYLLGHGDDRVRAWAIDALRLWGETPHLARVLLLLDEPRSECGASVAKLLGGLDLDRIEALARSVLEMADAAPAQLAWALDQVGNALPWEAAPVAFSPKPGQPPPVRRALARLASRSAHPDAQGWLNHLLDDPEPDVQIEALRGLNQRTAARLDERQLDRLLSSEHPLVRAEAVQTALAQEAEGKWGEALAHDADARVRIRLAECLAPQDTPTRDGLLVRLQADPHPHVRAAALTPARAAELMDDPTRETSWHVLARAARMMRVPFWRLEPAQPWRPISQPQAAPGPLPLRRVAPVHAHRLGPDGPLVAPLGISGHYGLPVEGFVHAVEAGVNLLFWEPGYQPLTQFAARLSAPDRAALHFLTGTFEADGVRIRRDVERALRMLKIERVAVFLLFWVQSWHRISPDVGDELQRLKEAGKVAAFGLSTHSRALAVEALETGWSPVMVRHNAAHRGAEVQVFPKAVERGTGVITFNNTCYGRLLRSDGEGPAPTAADCYRYTLAQPGVTACFSAPATLAELEANLAVLRDPELAPERRCQLEVQGDALYREEVIFRKLVRVL